MHRWFARWGRWVFPALGCVALFFFMYAIQKLGGFVLPKPTRVALAVVCGVTSFGYLLQLKLLNRIGGVTVLLLALSITFGMLVPRTTVERYPHSASRVISKDFDAAWKALYGKNLFKEFSLHENLMQYADSLARFDVYRAGQIGLFALFGIALGICFLFPIDPSKRLKYYGRFLLLCLAGVAWALQLELLQILSPSRIVSFVDFVESLIGLFAGLSLFALFNIAYVARNHLLSDRRFNVLGVGIDAVSMGDCLQLFEEIIEQWAGDCGDAALACGGSAPLSDEASLAAKARIDFNGGIKRGTGNQGPITLSSGLTTRLPAMTTAMGVAGIVESRRHQRLQRILNESVLNTPDGMPLVWLGKLFGYRSIERVYGPDLLRDACAHGEDKGWRHYFWGAAPGIVEKLKVVLEERHPHIQIAGICCPPFRPLTPEEEDVLVAEVNGADTDIFWIGISTPKQLYFMDHIRDRLNCKIICPVGYAFDVNAGVEKDAPDWIKYAGLQWLHRGIKQPRLWKRYIPDNPMFVLKVFAQLLHLKRFPMFMHERPIRPAVDAEGFSRFPAGCVSLSAMTLERARDRVANWVVSGQKQYANICTTDTVVQCYDRPDLAKIVMDAGMATTGGAPLVWLARYFGFADANRVAGLDLLFALCALGEEKGFRHYFCGASDEVLERLRENLLRQFPKIKIAGTYSPPFLPLTDEETAAVSERINAAKSDIVWCGLGTPLQDYWVAEFRPRLDCAALLAVGASFNLPAAHVRQAPRWMVKSKLAWLFHLVVESRHLRRHLVGNPRFVCQTLKQFVRARAIRKRMGAAQPRVGK